MIPVPHHTLYLHQQRVGALHFLFHGLPREDLGAPAPVPDRHVEGVSEEDLGAQVSDHVGADAEVRLGGGLGFGGGGDVGGEGVVVGVS